MNSSLNISILSDSLSLARSATEDAFNLLTRIENSLSMYIHSSEVYAINSAKVGEFIDVDIFTMELLELSSTLYNDTFGAFDVCMGQFFLNAKNQAKFENPTRLSLKIDPENFVVQKISDGYLDFGAIGKGYAIDKVVELFRDIWQLENVLINFGSSTLFALGKNIDGQDWQITLNGNDEGYSLKDSCAISASGTRTQDKHILDPMDLSTPDKKSICTYALVNNSASIADALSTAFTVLSKDEINEICSKFSAKYLEI